MLPLLEQPFPERKMSVVFIAECIYSYTDESEKDKPLSCKYGLDKEVYLSYRLDNSQIYLKVIGYSPPP